MKKLLLTTACITGLLLSAIGVSAQSAPGLRMGNVGLETGFALEDGFTIPIGGTFKYEAPISSQLHYSVTAGFINVQMEEELKDVTDMSGLSYVPVKAGVKYYLSGNLFIDGEIGAGIGVQEGSDTEFLWAPGVGYLFPVADDKFIDLSARFENIGDFSTLGIRLGYAFAL